ncbi:MAG: DegV family protein [Lachnospiraceae bacterium]|nr:DegV family protein [Lachnospiraceae bacterium]
MKNFIITTDSTCDLPESYYTEHNVPVLQLQYTVNGEEYGDDRQMDVHEVYEAMRKDAQVSTACINPKSAEKLFTEYVEKDYEILHIAFSSGLSASYSTASFVAKDVCEAHPGSRIVVIDSLCASGGQGLFLYYCVQMKEKGASMNEIISWAEEHKHNVRHEFTVESLTYLQRGGRISKAVAILGGLINVKPVLHVDNEGRLVSLKNVRGRKKSLSAIVDAMEEHYTKDDNDVIVITHGDSEEDANLVKDMIQERLGFKNFIISMITPTIGCHAGPGTIALFFMGTKR